MPLKRKIRNLPEMTDQISKMSFFDPVYPNEDENDLLADGNPRPTLFRDHQTESNETLINEDQTIISTTKISNRIKQIQNSIEQARTMLESMNKFQHIMPNTEQQREKLHAIISNLEEQKASYLNLFDVITTTEEEKEQFNDLALRHNIEPTNHQENSNYESLIGSLKSDTFNWQDQQSTSLDEETDDDEEYEKNLLLQKEQLRALEGQKRALLALQRRSEQRLLEQQQLATKKSTDLKENDLITDINHLRNRLKILRDIYEKKYQQLNSSNRLQNLQHIADRLDELEQIVNYYQIDIDHDEDDDIIVYDHTSISSSQTNISNDLATKRIELEQAKSALNQLQEMVKTIQPDQSSSSTCSTSRSRTPSQNDEKMAVQDQFISLHENLSTPMKTYEENLNNSTNRRPTYQSEFSEDLEKSIQPRLKQSNVYASDTIVGKSTDDLNTQLREICRCLSAFIDEQKTFNRQIEQRLTDASHSSSNPMFNQLQQQVVAQGLIVNLNTAYREIAVLQSEINALQSENTRLSTSLSFDNRYHQSKDSIYSFDHQKSTEILSTDPYFDITSKTSLNSQIDRELTPKKTLNQPRRSSKSFDERQFQNISSTNPILDQVDVQTLDLQVKSIMVQLIPYLRLHINEIFNQSNLNHIRERVLFLYKQQPDSAELIRNFQNEFSQSLAKTIEKYSGTTIRDCAVDLIRDISDVTFNELVKYKIYKNTNNNNNNEESRLNNDKN